MTPDVYTIQETFLKVGDGHTLYVHDWGNKKAKTPIVFLHGGPGGQCKDKHKQIFDPETQRVVFFDQRGGGKSTPLGSIEHNTTQHMIGDINKITEHLGIKTFVLTGGSWGSCLALAYTLEHPKRVHAMVINGIFTGSRQECNYIDKGMFRTHFPEVWETYLSRTPAEHRHDPSAYHYDQIFNGQSDERRDSAYAVEEMESALLRLDDRHTSSDIKEFDPSYATVMAHYLAQNCFMPDRYIIENADKITAPTWLVHGRYDFVCPPITAHELHMKLPNSELIWYIGGHHNEHESWNIVKLLLKQAVQ